jgi:uncharacterized protein (DUF488 family)
MKKEIWTIGHSTHTLEEFVTLLQSFRIETLIDVRSLPGSRKFPHFDKEALETEMPKNGIQYLHFKDLGGRRKTSKASRNTAWRLASFRGYADYMETDAFLHAVKRLEGIGQEARAAFFCAEAVWWSCHRSLIADFLKHRDWTVFHIMGVGKAQKHPYTRPARIVDHQLVYWEDKTEL